MRVAQERKLTRCFDFAVLSALPQNFKEKVRRVSVY